MFTVSPQGLRQETTGQFTDYAFHFINLLFGGSLSRVPCFLSARAILCIWLMATLILRNAYFGAMFNFLQTKMNHSPINTISKIMEFNYTLYLGTGIYDVMYWSFPNLRQQLSNNTNYMYIKDYSKILCLFHFSIQLFNSSIAYYELLDDDSFNGVFITDDTVYPMYNKLNRRNPSHLFPVSKERIAYIYFVFYLRKHSCLTTSLNNHIKYLSSSGIINYYINMYKDAHFMKIQSHKMRQTLSLYQMQGIFLICAVLYLVAFITFLIELISRII